ncbi:MAG: 3-hydroxyacyl-CoA dehydrogenase family protein, partial [Planctomycetota bacterium]
MTDRDSKAAKFQTVAVLGAGTMGAGIAQVCAQAGSSVVLQDISDEFVAKGLARVRDFLQKSVDKGKVTDVLRDEVLARITTTTDRKAAARGADLVIEAVPEKLDLKNGLFRELADVAAPTCVLASNTSSLSLAKVFAGVAGPERCIGMHFFNPVPLMALLELVRTDQTSPATIDAVTAYAGELGKEPILVKDSPGFASSRLGVCLGLEAIRMLESGVASAEDIDKAMVLGYGHPMG